MPDRRLVTLTVAGRSQGLSLPERPQADPRCLLGLEDGAGVWLFEDGSVIVWVERSLSLGRRSQELSVG